MFRTPRAVIGLDIGSSAVKAVELRPAGKGYRVAAFGTEPVPADSIVDGTIVDAAAVVDAVRRVFDGNKAFKGKRCLCLPLRQCRHREEDYAAGHDGVRAGRLDLLGGRAVHPVRHTGCQPRLPDSRPRNRAGIAREHGRSPRGRGEGEDRRLHERYRAGGADPVIVDVDAFALQNAYEVNYGLEPDLIVVLLNAGASAVNINILQGDQSVFTRDISMGGNAYTEALQKELDLTFDAAEQVKKGIPVDGATFEEAQPVLRAISENILLEIQKRGPRKGVTSSWPRARRG